MSLTCIVTICLVTFLHVWLHSCMLGCMYRSCRFDFKYCSFMLGHMCLCICVNGMHCLCMFMFACGQVYSDIMMVVVMHEVMVCFVVEVMH